MDEILKNEWCLGIGEEDTDFVLLDWDIDLLPDLYQQDNIRFEYNQWNQKWSKVSCTIFAAMWMVSDLMNYEFSLDEIKEVDELSYTKWRIRGQGWRVKNAVDLVAKWRNEKHWDLWKIAYYRISKYSDMVDGSLKKNYTLDTNFCPTPEYAKDYYLEDACLDWYDFWTNTNWHSVDIIREDHRAVKDSYKWRKTSDWKRDCNIYELKNPIAKLTNFSPRLYIYTKVAEDNLEEIKRLNSIKAKCNTIITNLWELWHLVNDENLRGILHYTANKLRNKIQDCNNELKKYI